MRPKKKSTKQGQGKKINPTIGYFGEPLLEFGYGQKMVYPRDGLFLFGPVDSTVNLRTTRFGAIGTPEGLRRFQKWSQQMASYIETPKPGPRSRAVEPQHIPFPGFAEAFKSEWPVEPISTIEDLDLGEIHRLLHIENRHEAIHAVVDQFVSRLIRENNRLENPPSFWFVVVPEIVYELGRPQSVVPKEDRTAGEVVISRRRAQGLKVQPTLFGADEQDAQVYEYAVNFRRQLKARLLKDRIVTQVVRETTSLRMNSAAITVCQCVVWKTEQQSPGNWEQERITKGAASHGSWQTSEAASVMSGWFISEANCPVISSTRVAPLKCS